MIENISIVVPYDFDKNNKLKLWFQSRSSGDFSGLQEFPGGKQEPGESSKACALREVHEEADVTLQESDIKLFKIKKVQLPKKALSLSIFLTNNISNFSEKGFIRFNLNETIRDKVSTLPANYSIIEELIQFLFESEGRTNKNIM